MSKILVLVSLLAIGFWATTALVSAQEQTSKVDLGVENPGILPSSPFYFLKEWRRSITRFFTTNPVKKAELELNEANERAAEIKKLEETTPSKIEAITKAVNNYQQNMERLRTRLEQLKQTSENPNVDKLLDKLVERSLQHQQLFDNLKLKFEEKAELKEQLKASQEKIDEIITKIPEKFEGVEAFGQRLKKAVENQTKSEIKEKLPEVQQEKIRELEKELKPPIKEKIQKIKEEIFCIQVITPAISPEGACQEFPTPCDVPSGWQKVNQCPVTGTSTQE